MKNLLTFSFLLLHTISYSLDNLFPVDQNSIFYFDSDDNGQYFVENLPNGIDRITMVDISGDRFAYCNDDDAFIVSPNIPLNGQIDIILKFELIKFETNDPLCIPTNYFFGVGAGTSSQQGIYNILDGDGEISLASIFGDLSQYDFLNFAFVGSGIGVELIFEIDHVDVYPSIPTMDEWGFICLSLLMVIFGAVSLRNKPINLIKTTPQTTPNVKMPI